MREIRQPGLRHVAAYRWRSQSSARMESCYSGWHARELPFQASEK